MGEFHTFRKIEKRFPKSILLCNLYIPYKDKSTKNKFLNPIFQNKLHINALRELLRLEDSFFNNIVAFSERCELKKVTTVTKVIKRTTLISTLEKLMLNNKLILRGNDVENIKNKLLKYCNVNNEVKEHHIQNIKRIHNK